MGTDIHCFMEKQNIDQWVFVKEISIKRNYALFGCLYEGIRGWYGFCNIPQREIPNDLTKTTLGHLNEDCHSHGYIFTCELPIVQKSFVEAITESYKNDVEISKKSFERFGKEGQTFQEFWNDIYDGITLGKRIEQRLNQFKKLFSLKKSTDFRLVYWLDN